MQKDWYNFKAEDVVRCIIQVDMYTHQNVTDTFFFLSSEKGKFVKFQPVYTNNSQIYFIFFT